MTGPLIRGYEVVIGLETHTQLSTASKIFSGSSTAFGAAPNTQASAVDLALPGALPVMNKGAVERAIRFGLAVGAKIAPQSIFARKNYFYPDLPKGYQISQYEIPVVQGGTVEFVVGTEKKTVHLTRAHLEEDAGKSLHEDYQGQSGIDLNRAGTPLLEIVSEPDMRSSAEAVAYAKALHTLVVWLGICDGNMQEGSFRCDANVSVRKPGQPYGTRREIKNLNSFKFMQQAIDFEVQWQIDRVEDGLKIEQATVLFDPATGETRAMRSKEDAQDYRYFPDPDLPPLVIALEWVERVKATMPELPGAMAARFERVDGLSAYDAAMMTQSPSFASYYEKTRDVCQQPKLAANWIMGELSSLLKESEARLSIENFWVRPSQLGELILRVVDGTISNKVAKAAFALLVAATRHAAIRDELNDELRDIEGKGPSGQVTLEQIIDAKGWRQLSDSGALEKIVDDVLAANAKSVEEFRAGKDKAFNALVGQVMKASKGQANPTQASDLLKKKLGAG
jgi:aspartyl-tRNA(Asn)/glutamyl-tRNA(Gln) amidotransferase subunit B